MHLLVEVLEKISPILLSRWPNPVGAWTNY